MSYLARTCVIGALFTPAVASLDNSPADTEQHSLDIRWLAAAILLLAYWIFFVVLPRCRDLNLTRWEKILLFIPPIGLPLWGRLTWSRSRPFLDTPLETSVTVPSEPKPPPLQPPAAIVASKSDSLLRLEKLRADGTLTEDEFQRMKTNHGL